MPRPPSDPLLRAGDIRASASGVRAAPGTGLSDEALLSLPPADVAELRNAARFVARRTMKDAHGCTGRSCESPRHAADREQCDHDLAALGLAGGRDRREYTNPWGERRQWKRQKKERD